MVEAIGASGIRPHYHYLKRVLKPEDSLLEVGCGPCDLYGYLSQEIEINYSGCDLTDEMLKEASKRYPSINLFECNVEEMMNVDNQAYDWIVCSDVVIHIAKPIEAIQNLWRCTKGALLLVLRDSTYPEHIIDISKSYQTSIEGNRYYYNILNKDKLLEFIMNLNPRPLAVDIYRKPLRGNVEARRTINFDQNRYKIWQTYISILKDNSKIKWLGTGEVIFDNRNIFHRVFRKIRAIMGRKYRWEG